MLKIFKYFCVIVWIGVVFASCSEKPVEENPSNIILISLDNLRADHLGCYGYHRNTSPFIDSLSKEGTLFTRTVAQDTWTLPSHISLLSSLYIEAHGVRSRDERLPETSPPMLQEILKEKGYATIAFTTCDFVSPSFGIGRGFDHFRVDHISAEKLNSIVLDHLDSIKEGPFFLFLHYYDIHQPFDETNPYGEDFVPKRANRFEKTLEIVSGLVGRKVSDITKEELKAIDDLGYLNDEILLAGMETKPNLILNEKHIWEWMIRLAKEVDPADAEIIEAKYDHGIAYMDYHLAGLFERLEEFPWYDDAIVAITSDHGEAFNEHRGIMGHGGPPYGEETHVPFLLNGKGIPEGVRIASPTASIDIAPTLLDLVKLKTPGFFQGRTLVDCLRGGKPIESQPILSGSLEKDRIAIQYDRWKTVYDPYEKSYRLYDLESPEGESRDVAKDQTKTLEWLKKMMFEKEETNRRIGADHPPVKVKLDEEAMKRLEALGY